MRKDITYLLHEMLREISSSFFPILRNLNVESADVDFPAP
jgi:hypothetical protein